MLNNSKYRAMQIGGAQRFVPEGSVSRQSQVPALASIPQRTIDKDYANEYIEKAHQQMMEKNTPYNPFYDMRMGVNALSFLSGNVERGRQNQYMGDQLSTLGQMNPMPVDDYQPNPFSMYAKYGGSLKKYQQGGKATRADSLAVYNAQLAQNQYYDKFKNAFDKRITHPVDKRLMETYTENLTRTSMARVKEAIDDFEGRGSLGENSRNIQNENYASIGVSTTQLSKKIGQAYNVYKNQKDSNDKIYYQDLITGDINLTAPFALLDKRIKPQTVLSRYTNGKNYFPGSNVSTFQYDLLSVKPWDLLTSEERELRNKKYGKPQQQEKPPYKVDGKTVGNDVEFPDMNTPQMLRPGITGLPSQKPTNYVATWRDESLPDKTAKKYFNSLEAWREFTDNRELYNRASSSERADGATSSGYLIKKKGGKYRKLR